MVEQMSDFLKSSTYSVTDDKKTSVEVDCLPTAGAETTLLLRCRMLDEDSTIADRLPPERKVSQQLHPSCCRQLV